MKNLFLATSCILALAAPAIVTAENISLNRVGAFTSSGYGDADFDMNGVSMLYAHDDRYTLMLEYADLDLGLPIDTTMIKAKVGLGSYGKREESGWGVWYLGYTVIDLEFMGESESTDAVTAGMHFINNQNGNIEVVLDLGIIHPLDDDGGDTTLEARMDVNYYITENFAVGVHGSIDNNADGIYGLGATLRF